VSYVKSFDETDGIEIMNLRIHECQLFDKKFYFYSGEREIESFKFFISLLEKRMAYEEAFNLYIQDTIKRLNLPNNISSKGVAKFMIANDELFQKLKDYYCNTLRDFKINNIIDE
jgi:hypothetical protein